MCSKGISNLPPEKIVEGYLNTAFSLSDVRERDQLMQYTTGKLRDSIAAASDETLKKAYIDRKFELLGYSVIERKDRTPRETEITFRLRYKDLGIEGEPPTDAQPVVTTENTVSVIREKGTWLIRDVIGAKTSFDFPVSKNTEVKPRPEGQRTEVPDDDDSGLPPVAQ